MSGCCSRERSTTPGTPDITLRTSSPSLRRTVRSSPNTFTATLARVPDNMWSMRCEIGWPIVTFRPGMPAKSRRSVAELPLRAVLHPEPDVDLRRVHVLRVLVELRPPGPPGGGHHLRVLQERLLDHEPEPVRLLERGAGEGNGRERQRALIELGEERPAREKERERGGGGETEAGSGGELPARQEAREERLVTGLEPVDELPFLVLAHRPRVRERGETKCGRDGEGDEQRGRERDHVREPERLEETPLDAGEEEQGEEHQDDDERREHDGAADLAARLEDDSEVVEVSALAVVLPQPAHHVLDVDDGVVDESK